METNKTIAEFNERVKQTIVDGTYEAKKDVLRLEAKELGYDMKAFDAMVSENTAAVGFVRTNMKYILGAIIACIVIIGVLPIGSLILKLVLMAVAALAIVIGVAIYIMKGK